MSELWQTATYRYAKHASATDVVTAVTATPPLRPLNPVSQPTGMHQRQREKIETPAYSGDAEVAKMRWGKQDISEFSIEQYLYSTSGNTGGLEVDYQDSNEQCGDMLDLIFGANATYAASAAQEIVSSATSTTLTTASAHNIVQGEIIFFNTSLGWRARQVLSVSGTQLTFDHEYTGTPVVSSTIIRTSQWMHEPTRTRSTHAFFDVETDTFRSRFFGCAGNATFKAEPGGPLTMTTTWVPTSVDQSTAVANITYADPVQGPLVVAGGGCLYMGNKELEVRDFECNLNYNVQPFSTYCGENGVLGARVIRGAPTMTFTALFGATAGEIDITEVSAIDLTEVFGNSDLKGGTTSTYKTSIQFGSSYLGGAYFTMGAAEIVSSELVNVDGLIGLKMTVRATRTTDYASSFYLALT